MRNTNSHFSYAPSLSVSRSSFDRPSTHKTTFDKAGLLYPIFLDEVLPGDTHSLKTSLVCRAATPIFPVMDNMFLDIYYFFVPMRLVWEHWKEFMGENTQSAWIQQVTYTVPQINLGGVQSDSVADHFGLRPNQNSTSPLTVSALPFRAFAEIWNEWFRPESILDPIAVPKGDAGAVYVGFSSSPSSTDYLTSTVYGGLCPPVSKFGDYFTSCLPGPQKGPDVLMPLGNLAPVFAHSTDITSYNLSQAATVANSLSWSKGGSATGVKPTSAGSIYHDASGETVSMAGSAGSNITLAPSNLFADLSAATAATIRDLYLATAVQEILQTDARSGSRYVELILSHFGVRSPDYRLQRPEYLGGKRVRINMQQVLQTGATGSGSTPQGNVSAFSLTADSFGSFSQSFTEHGLLIGCATIRTSQTYQYSIERGWFRKERFDYYFPALAHIGEQEVKNREIYANFDYSADDENTNGGIFGYQEAWAEYRYKPSIISGAFRSNSSANDDWTSIDSWHYAEKLTGLPTLGPDFIEQSNEPVARTLAVQNDDEFICDFYFDMKSTRCMPTYSIPGLVARF